MNNKLTKLQVCAIRRSKEPDRVLALKYKVSRSSIIRARTGNTFSTVKAKPTRRSCYWSKILP